MNHTFRESQTFEKGKCLVCGYNEIAHTDQASCDFCDYQGEVERGLHGLYCPKCLTDDEKFKTIPVTAILQTSREIDNRLQVRSDLFNAYTVSILDLKKGIDADSNIANKAYVLAEELLKRFDEFKTKIFSLRQELDEAGNAQKAIQIYLNQLANQITQEERDKLKIADINYKPREITTPVKPKKISAPKNKATKEELRKAAAQYGVPEYHIQMLMLSKNLPLVEAAKLAKSSLEAIKAKAGGQ